MRELARHYTLSLQFAFTGQARSVQMGAHHSSADHCFVSRTLEDSARTCHEPPPAREDSDRHLGFHFHAKKDMANVVAHLVPAAKKAVHAMRRRCVAISIQDTALQCKLFKSQVMPILSYASEVWAVHLNVGAG